jgi:hypothetical protein
MVIGLNPTGQIVIPEIEFGLASIDLQFVLQFSAFAELASLSLFVPGLNLTPLEFC